VGTVGWVQLVIVTAANVEDRSENLVVGTVYEFPAVAIDLVRWR
jgi:hypothetical protein